MATTAGTQAPPLRRSAGAPQGLTLAFAGFLPVMGIVSLAPAVPTIIGRFADAPQAHILVPLMVTAPGLMIALLAPFAGLIADKYGRRFPILLATFAYAFFGTAPFFLDDLRWIFGSRLAVGISEAFILTVVNALFADYFEANARRRWITVQGVLGPILGTATIMASGFLTTYYWNGAFLIYITAFLIFVTMLAFFYEPARAQPAAPGQEQAGTAFPWLAASKYAAITLFAATLYYVFIVQGGLAFQAIGVASSGELGMRLGIASVGVPIGALAFNFLSKRHPSDRLLSVFLALFGIGIGGMGIARDADVMTVFAFIQQIGAGMAVTSMIFWVSQLLPPQHRGRGFGIWTGAFFIGQFLSPAVVGLVRGFSGGILPTFLIMGLAAVVGAAVIQMLRRRLPQPLETQ